MRVCLLDQAGVVVNVVLANEAWTPPPGLTIGPEGGNIGDRWDGSRYAGLEAPHVELPTAGDVRAEAQRRIQGLLGAENQEQALVLQTKAHEEAIRILDKRASGAALTQDEEAAAARFRTVQALLVAIRAASNAMEPAPPADFAADRHWPVIPG